MTTPPPTPATCTLLGEVGWVRTLARSLVADAHAAEDLAQDACVVALDRPPAHAGNLRAWLRTVMQNLLRQRARSDARRGERERAAQALRPVAGDAADELVVRATAHRAVVDAVLALPATFRDVVLLRFFEDEPPRAIAARLRIPVATVHSRLLRAQGRLRQQLDRAHGSRWRRALLPLPAAAPTVPVLVAPLGFLVMNTKLLAAAAALVVGSAAIWIASGSADAPPVETPHATVRSDGPPAAPPGTPPATGGRERRALAPEPDAQPAPRRRDVVGRVVDGEGRPAPGVRVLAGDLRGATDATGAFTWSTIDHAGQIARADDPAVFTILEGVVAAGASPPPVLVVIGAAVQLAGHVRDGRGRPVAAARVQVVWPADLRSRLRDVSDAASERHVAATCRDDGAFAFTAGALRGAELLASAPGFSPHRRPLPARDDPALAIVLEPLDGKPGTVQGQVVDPHGRAVADARVGLGAALARSDAGGNFVIEDDGTGKALAASAAGHRRGLLDRGEGFPGFVLLPLGGAPLSIRGRVVDELGNGVPDIVVWPSDPTLLCAAREQVFVEGVACGHPTQDELRARFDRGEFAGMEPQQVVRSTPTAGRAWVRTSTDGSFALGGLEDRPYRLRAIDHETVLMTERDAVAAGTDGVQLVLDRSQLFTEVRGVVVARDGSPVPGVRVQVQIDTQSIAGRTHHERAVATATTDERGAFTLPKVPKAWAYFRLDGDRVIPSEHGRGHDGGLLDLSGGRPHEFRFEVRVRLHMQVELLDPARADAIAVLDGDGRPLILNVFQGRSRSEMPELRLAEGRSPVFVVPDTAAVLVLRKAGAEVGRETLSLRPGDVNSLRL